MIPVGWLWVAEIQPGVNLSLVQLAYGLASVSVDSQRWPKPAFQRFGGRGYRRHARLGVAWLWEPKHTGSGARWRLVVLFRPSSLAGAGGLGC